MPILVDRQQLTIDRYEYEHGNEYGNAFSNFNWCSYPPYAIHGGTIVHASNGHIRDGINLLE
jgi:hypothetical protein